MISTSTIHCMNKFCTMGWQFYTDILQGVYILAGKHLSSKRGKKYTSGPRYWNLPVLVNTGTFLVYQYFLKMWYLRSLEHVGVIQKLTILECKNGIVLSNTRVPVSGTWSILFPKRDFPKNSQEDFFASLSQETPIYSVLP